MRRAMTPLPVSIGRRSRRDRGSVMFLFPVGFLIVVILGGIALDLGNVWLQQRRLADAADSAANDAATYGLDIDALRAEGAVALNEDRVLDAVRASVAGQNLPPQAAITDVRIGVGPDGGPTVTVAIDSQAELIFGRIVRNDGIAISATGTAELIDGG